jgi:hypothetical protein
MLKSRKPEAPRRRMAKAWREDEQVQRSAVRRRALSTPQEMTTGEQSIALFVQGSITGVTVGLVVFNLGAIGAVIQNGLRLAFGATG